MADCMVSYRKHTHLIYDASCAAILQIKTHIKEVTARGLYGLGPTSKHPVTASLLLYDPYQT